MKKLLAIILACAMAMALLAGCGSTTEAPADSAVQTESTEEGTREESPAAEPAETEDAEEPAEAEDSEEDAEAEDAAPEESPYEKVSYELPLFEETKEFSVFYPLRKGGGGSTMPTRDSEDYPFWARLQENLNVDLTFREPMDDVAATQYNLMVASGDLTDLVFESIISTTSCAYTAGYDKAIEDDIYINLMDYIEYAPNYAYYALGNEANAKVIVTDDGNIGAFMKIFSEPEKTNIGLTAHKSYLDDTGLPMPETVDDWMEVFASMAANGVKYPCDVNVSGQIQNGAFARAMGACLDTAFLVDAETGGLVFGPTTEETKEYIELFIEISEKGWMDPDWFNFMGMENPLFVDGSIATCTQIGQRLESLSTEYGFDLEPCPVVHREGYGPGELAIGEVAYPLASSGGGIAITTACEDIEGAMTLIDWTYSDEGAELCGYGWIEGETYEIIDGQKRINDFYQATNEVYTFGNKTLYTSDRDFGYVHPNLSYYVARDLQKLANDRWTPVSDNASAIYMNLPGSVRLNSDESSELTTLISDLQTYIQSTFYGWMCGTTPYSDSAWDEFVSNCQAMSLSDIQEGYEAAYQRYLDK